MTIRLYCVRCFRRKPRTEFRETPWHRRAAACESCERFTYWDTQLARAQWELEQSRERTRGLRRGLRLIRTAKLSPYHDLRRYQRRYVLGTKGPVR